MIHVTTQAHEKLQDIIKDNQNSMIRIGPKTGGG